MRTGVYRTEYGNAAVVINDETIGFMDAYDLDSAELIPMEVVTDELIREADETDLATAMGAFLRLQRDKYT